MISPHLFKSIAVLSILQTVFSKRSADTLQSYLGASTASFQDHQNHVGSAYRIRKHGLAFVQSQAIKYLNSKSEQVFNALSSKSITKRDHFALSFGLGINKDAFFTNTGFDTRSDKTEAMNVPKSTDTGIAIDKGVSDLPSWAKRTLFQNYDSVQGISAQDFHQVSKQGSINAKLAGAVYDGEIETVHSLGHSFVINGTSANVKWMVTDRVGYDTDFESTPANSDSQFVPTIIRTITIRGFDAFDETVDREELLTELCHAGKVPLSDDVPGLQVHRGLLEIAKVIYQDIKPYIQLTGPTHKIVLNGHSIGGSLANLVLMLMTVERGNVYVQEKVKRVYTFGSPPIAKADDDVAESNDSSVTYGCSILETLGLPADIVYSFVEPWDPIVRLFSTIDPLYPFIEDLGDDGFSIYSTGPPRILAPIITTILSHWENWPKFRDNNRAVMQQDYVGIGVQHLLMSDLGRFLSDRILAVDINAYPVDDILRVSSRDLYGALDDAFPLDDLSISVLPTAIRSFIHHFSPAYVNGFDSYVRKEEKKVFKKSSKKREMKPVNTFNDYLVHHEMESASILISRTFGIDLADYAPTWVLGGE